MREVVIAPGYKHISLNKVLAHQDVFAVQDEVERRRAEGNRVADEQAKLALLKHPSIRPQFVFEHDLALVKDWAMFAAYVLPEFSPAKRGGRNKLRAHLSAAHPAAGQSEQSGGLPPPNARTLLADGQCVLFTVS